MGKKASRLIVDSIAWYRSTSVTTKLFIGLVVLPTLIASIYYGVLASDVYISEARYAVRTNSDSGPTSILDSVLSGGAGSSAGEDAMVVRDYILSRDMLAELDSRLAIRRHFESNDIDRFSRLSSNASTERFVDYYQDIVEVKVHSGSNITVLRVRAFAPEVAHRVAKTIITLSEELVNQMSARIIDDTLHFVRQEVNDAETRVRLASSALTNFRSETRSIDPGQETSAVLGIVTELESRLAEARTALIEARGFMRHDSPQVQTLKGRVDALQEQVADERKRLASEEGTAIDYTQLIDDYEPLVLEQELAKQRYTSALTSLEIAQAEAQRKQRYLLPFVEPQIPDEAVEPARFSKILFTFIGSCLVFAIGSLVWAAIKDHLRQ